MLHRVPHVEGGVAQVEAAVAKIGDVELRGRKNVDALGSTFSPSGSVMVLSLSLFTRGTVAREGARLPFRVPICEGGYMYSK